jgi:hypothetical protein
MSRAKARDSSAQDRYCLLHSAILR